MKIAHPTPWEPTSWGGGISYFMAQEFQNQSTEMKFIGPLKERYKRFFGLKWRYYKYIQHQNYQTDRTPCTVKDMASQIKQELATLRSDIVLSPFSWLLSYLDCQQPRVIWADATFSGLVNFYLHNLCQESLRNSHAMEQAALDRCSLAIFTSDWAAKSAIEDYKTDPAKVKVIPYGANLRSYNSDLAMVKAMIKSRPSNHCHLLFLGVDWVRKGGNIALEVARQLNERGLKTTLTIVGCHPFDGNPPNFVRSLGFIAKWSEAGNQQINRLIAESHFLILPSIADCTPMVFGEANAFGVPCLSTDVGGIPTIIQNDVNGKSFAISAKSSAYSTYIEDLFANYSDYQELALSSFHQYESRLNWQTAVKSVKDLMLTLL